jgi:type I restriction enzyme R subunit
MAQTRDLVALYIMCVPSAQALKIRDDVAFFEAVRGQISKIEGSDREGADASAILDTAIKQIVSEAMTGSGVIDIYAEAGLAKPDLSLIDDDFVNKFKKSKTPNLQIEMLKRILSQEIRRVSKRNIVTGRAFSEMLEQSILRYQNRTLDAAQVVAELVELAKGLKAEGDRGAALGLNDDELAFYDAICTNDSAVLELGDDTLKKIAHELVAIVRRDAKTDWSVKEQVRAKLRSTIGRLLLTNGYPPDNQEAATQLVLEQAEVIAGQEAA